MVKHKKLKDQHISPFFWLCNRNEYIIQMEWFTSTSDGVTSKNITRKLGMILTGHK